MLSGYTGEGAKTVLPAKAMAKVSFRLVPGQSPDRVKVLLQDHLARVAPAGVDLTVVELHGGRPWRARLEGPLFNAASRALERSVGARPVLAGEGGSIPIVGEFEEILGANSLLLGSRSPAPTCTPPTSGSRRTASRRGSTRLSTCTTSWVSRLTPAVPSRQPAAAPAPCSSFRQTRPRDPSPQPPLPPPERGPATPNDHGADGDRGIHLGPAPADMAHRTRIRTSRSRLQLVDDLHGTHLGAPDTVPRGGSRRRARPGRRARRAPGPRPGCTGA